MWRHKQIISLKATEKIKYPDYRQHTYNLLYTVNFITRIQNNSRTTIDNTFSDSSKINLSTVSSILNGLSYHDVQILIIKNVYATINKSPLKQRTRLIDNGTITNFHSILIKET
jgi:hypothetical protein